MREWLGLAVEEGRRRDARVSGWEERESARQAEIQSQAEAARPPRLSVDFQAHTMTVDGICHQVDDVGAAFIQVMLNEEERISLKEIAKGIKVLLNGREVDKLDRLRGKLPAAILATLDVTPKGHRIKSEYKRPSSR